MALTARLGTIGGVGMAGIAKGVVPKGWAWTKLIMGWKQDTWHLKWTKGVQTLMRRSFEMYVLKL